MAQTKEQTAKRRYYLKNRKRIIARVRAYRAKNIDRVRAYDRDRYPARKAERSEYSRTYRRKHKRRLAAQAKANAAKNKDAIRKRQRAWYLADKARLIAKAAASAKRHPKKRRQVSNRYYARNKHYYRAACVLRRARQKSATIGHTGDIAAFYRKVRTAKSVACHWCKRPVRKGRRTIDHVIPLAKGGKHCVTNLVPACATCNRRKGCKLPHLFVAA